MKRLIPLLIALFLLGSFQHEDSLIPIESKIQVTSHITKSGVAINGVTHTIYPCMNYKVTFKKEISHNKIQIYFEKIAIPKICATALGPATCVVDLGSLAAGEYEMLFILNKEETKGTLNVGTTVNLTLESAGNVN